MSARAEARPGSPARTSRSGRRTSRSAPAASESGDAFADGLGDRRALVLEVELDRLLLELEDLRGVQVSALGLLALLDPLVLLDLPVELPAAPDELGLSGREATG
jgi:hypothetical protein